MGRNHWATHEMKWSIVPKGEDDYYGGWHCGAWKEKGENNKHNKHNGQFNKFT